MDVSSNAYATKIFSEHPISLYALDDDVSYVSLINNEQRLFGPVENLQTERVNLSPNPSIETNASTWVNSTGGLAPVRTTQDSLFGEASLLIKKNTSAGTVRVTHQVSTLLRTAPVTPGKNYSVSAYIKPLENNRLARTRLTFYDSSNVAIGSTITGSSFSTLVDRWTRVSQTNLAPAGASTVLVQVEILNALASEEFLLDGLLLEESSSILPYLDENIIENWSVVNGIPKDDIPLPTLPSPFVGEIYGGIQGYLPLENNTNIEWTSPVLFQLSDLNQDMSTFAIACYLYQSSIFVNWYEIGYSAGSEEFVTRVEAPDRPAWINFDLTYLPEQFNIDQVKIIIRANVNLTRGSATGQSQDYRFIVNGLTVGQWSEATSSKSLGAIPQNTDLGYSGVVASEYGINDDPGYYIVENNRLLAKNEGTPLVYGSENVTRIYPAVDEDTPSLILPGQGFLFESDRYSQYTVEFWIKLDPNTEQFKRIFGPLDNDYGIYINNGFISLLVGDNFGSHTVSEWYRPMLIHFVLNSREALLYINGENVISIPLDRSSLDLPAINNWLGFYSDPEINIFELDSFSIYSYVVPLQVAKRRLVYGQGTDSPDTVASSFLGETSYVDFSNANYTSNTIYPDIANWNAGYKDNLISAKSSISVPNYSLPEITLIGRDIEELYAENKITNEQAGETFFTFRPFSPSTANLILNGIFDEGIDTWEKINNTSLKQFFDVPINENVMRVASFNSWQRVLVEEELSSYSSAVASDNPVGWWRLNDATGNAINQTGSSNGVYVGDPTRLAGPLSSDGNSVGLNGSTQYVTIAAQTNINNVLTDNWSVEAWFVCNDVSPTVPQIIWEEGGVNNGINLYVYNQELYGLMWTSEGIQKRISVPVSNDNVYHAVFVGGVTENRCELYLNGVSVGTIFTNQATQLPGHADGNGVGSNNAGTRTHIETTTATGSWSFNGRIGDVARYNYALSKKQIVSHYLLQEILDWDIWDEDDWESVLFFESDGFFAGAKLIDRVEISPNLVYRFSIDVKRVLGVTDDPYVSIEWFDAASDGNKIGETVVSQSVSLPINQWQNIGVSALSPIGATHAELKFYMSESEIPSGQIQFVNRAQFIPLELNWTEPGYMFFNSLNFVERLTSFYGVFSSRDLISYSPLVVINNVSGFDKFKIFVQDKKIRYSFNDVIIYQEEIDFESNNNGYEEYFYSPSNQEYVSFACGINISKFSKNYGYEIAKFFQSPELLQMYIAGDTVETFYDKFYKFGFCNDINNQEIENYFLDNGVVDRFESENFTNHFASYTLTPINRYNRFFMDISVSSTWEEYFPLTIFAGFVKNSEGELYYDVDMLQINLGYPPVLEIIQETIQDLRWTYAELFEEFNSPIQKSYNILNNPLLSQYEIYQDLDFRRITQFFFNTDRSSLKGYVTFQALSDGANEPISNFPFTRKLRATQVIDAEIENSSVQPYRSYLTKFEFIDKTIVYPPKTINFEDIAMVVHFEIKQEGILSNPLRVRDFEITSRALSQYDFNPIGTEFGIPMFPFVKSNIYYDNKEKNPMIISKRRFPYLYLTKDSGLQLLGNQTLEKEYSSSIPVNTQRAPGYNIGAMQFWMKFDRVEFPTIAYPVFEIEGSDQTIEFVIRTDASGKRGTLVARDKQSKMLEPGIMFYQNGIRVKSPIIEINQWNAIGIDFATSILFDALPGYITFFRGISFHNVSHYRAAGLGESLATLTRLWSKVLSDDDINNFSWATWYVGADQVITQTRTNLAYNPSVEIDLTGWSPTGGGMTVNRITTDSRFGDASARCVLSASNNSGILFGNLSGERISISPNTEYTVSAYVRIPSGSPDKTLRFRIRQHTNVTGGSILPIINGTQLFNFGNNDGWIRMFFTFTTAASANAIGIEISQQTGNISGDIFYADALLLEESAALFPKVNRYFDGSVAVGGLLSQSLVWDGTPHDSSSTVIYFVPSEDQISQWLDVYVSDQFIDSVLTPQDIYKSFVGTNQIVVDSGSTLDVEASTVVSLSDARWNRISGKPV